MTIPSEDDWRSEEWCLDTEWAYKHFHGKSMEEATQLFEENAIYYEEDLFYMPSRVVGFYIESYANYLMSPSARGDSDGASCFISLINFKAEHHRDEILPLWPKIEPVLKKLAEQQDDFDAEWVPYGSFRSRIHEIVNRGFRVSFDTAIPELVPQSVTLREARHVTGPVAFPVAVQIFHNSGIDQVDITSEKPDILRVFGPPDRAGGGNHPKYGHIPDWIRYDRPDCVIRFEFDRDAISNVTFMAPGEATETDSADGIQSGLLERWAEASASWDALFEPPPHNEESDGDIRSNEGGR